jgi:ferredoxin
MGPWQAIRPCTAWMCVLDIAVVISRRPTPETREKAPTSHHRCAGGDRCAAACPVDIDHRLCRAALIAARVSAAEIDAHSRLGGEELDVFGRRVERGSLQRGRVRRREAGLCESVRNDPPRTLRRLRDGHASDSLAAVIIARSPRRIFPA